MNNSIDIAIVVRGKVIDGRAVNSSIEAERYKAAVRRWGREYGVAVSVMTLTAPGNQDSHWPLTARAC